MSVYINAVVVVLKFTNVSADPDAMTSDYEVCIKVVWHG